MVFNIRLQLMSTINIYNFSEDQEDSWYEIIKENPVRLEKTVKMTT